MSSPLPTATADPSTAEALTICNENLVARFSTLGAELCSLCELTTGREHIWQGDARYWTGHAPILFPVTGSLWQGECRIEGQVHRLLRHGYARHRQWSVAEHSADRIVFALLHDEAEEPEYPWHYRLTATYALSSRTLRCTLRVESLETKRPLYFQLGGHPSVCLPDHQPTGQDVQGYLRLFGTPTQLLRAGEGGCIEAQRYAIPWAAANTAERLPALQTAEGVARDAQGREQLIPIANTTFAHEALIFAEGEVSGMEVLGLDGRRLARFSSSAPVWLVWQPEHSHAPFVCCEPWQGLPDPIGFAGEIQDRPYIVCLEAAQSWEGFWTMEV